MMKTLECVSCAQALQFSAPVFSALAASAISAASVESALSKLSAASIAASALNSAVAAAGTTPTSPANNGEATCQASQDGHGQQHIDFKIWTNAPLSQATRTPSKHRLLIFAHP